MSAAELYYAEIGIPYNMVKAKFFEELNTADEHEARLAQIYAGLKKYLAEASKDSKSMLFYGPFGSGKSFAACEVLKYMAYKKYFTSWYMTLDDAFELISESWKSDENKQARDRKLYLSQCLLIDNAHQALNKSRDVREVLPVILRKRLASGGITYLTTSVVPEDWRKVFGAECLSLFNENFLKVGMPQFDFRTRTKN